MINATNNIIETRHAAETESTCADAHVLYSFTYDSEGARSHLGIEPREIYGNEHVGFEIVHPDDLAPLLKSIKVSTDAKVLTDNGLKYIYWNEKSIIGAQINYINDTRTFCTSENGEIKYGKSQNKDNETTFYFSIPDR
jgi:hypothetical protein